MQDNNFVAGRPSFASYSLVFFKKVAIQEALIMVEKGRKIIRDLFEAFVDKPQLMPWVTQRKFNEAHETAKKWRVVCDFISGMTDRYAMETYSRLFEPNEKVMQRLI